MRDLLRGNVGDDSSTAMGVAVPCEPQALYRSA